MKKYYLGIDIGTFESKGVLIDDESFRIVASHAVAHGMENPHPNHFEHDAEAVWWHDYCEITRTIITESGIRPEDIACVGTSTLGTDCLPVDENCRPLRKAILYGIDARADKEIAYLNEYYGEKRVMELYGHALCSDDIAPKILWIKNNEPEVYARTYKFITGPCFITARLTGNYKMDHFLAKSSFKPIYNPDGSVNERECALYCRPDQVAECAQSTDLAGYVTEQASRETGLAVGTPVIVGTGDSTAEAISGGLTQPGNLLMQFGSSMFYYFCMDHQVDGNEFIKGGGQFTIPNTYCLGGGTNAAGTLTRWVRDTFYAAELAAETQGGENAYSIMAREAAEVPAGSDGLVMLPYIFGERSPLFDPHAKGVLFGLTGTHTRKHINRAALEAVGYSCFQHLCLFRELALEPDTVTIAGGGTKNATWMQITADIMGVPITVSEPWQTASYGDAMMATIGCGTLKNFQELKQAMPKCPVVQPNMDNHEKYLKYYEIFTALYRNNKNLMHQLDNLRADMLDN